MTGRWKKRRRGAPFGGDAIWWCVGGVAAAAAFVAAPSDAVRGACARLPDERYGSLAETELAH